PRDADWSRRPRRVRRSADGYARSHRADHQRSDLPWQKLPVLLNCLATTIARRRFHMRPNVPVECTRALRSHLTRSTLPHKGPSYAYAPFRPELNIVAD